MMFHWPCKASFDYFSATLTEVWLGFLDYLDNRSGCPHVNYLARNANPSLWTLVTHLLSKLFKSAYMYLASYYTLLFVQLIRLRHYCIDVKTKQRTNLASIPNIRPLLPDYYRHSTSSAATLSPVSTPFSLFCLLYLHTLTALAYQH